MLLTHPLFCPLYFRVRTFPKESDLGHDTIRALMYYALKVWSDITPLNFHEVAGNSADIQIDFSKADHNDGYPFDGPGGTVAHAFFPGDHHTAGDTHFDDDEYWTFRSSGRSGWESCSQTQGLRISPFCSGGWSASASATPSPQASGSLKSSSDCSLSLASKINPGNVEDTLTFLEASMASPCFLPCQQLQNSPSPNPSPQLCWDLDGCRLGMWVLEHLDGDCIL